MSLVATLMQPLRLRYQNSLDKNELRRSKYGAWNFYQAQSNLAGGILTADMNAAIKKSMGNSVVVPVLNADTVTIGSTRSCIIAPSENTSALVTLTFVTYAFAFTMTPARHFNNDVSYQSDFDRKMDKYLLKFAEVLDTAAVANLSTNKNTFFPAAVTNYYPVVGNALQVTQAQKNDFYNQLNAVEATMDWYGQTNVISSVTGMPMVDRLKAQGAGNSVNENFQFGGYEWYYTNRLTNGSGVQATMYTIPDGMVAVDNRNDPDAIAGSRVGNFKIWSQERMPIVNLNMGAYYYEDCADQSALDASTTNLTRTKIEAYEFSTDICFINTYNSSPSTKYNPIVKTEISAT